MLKMIGQPKLTTLLFATLLMVIGLQLPLYAENISVSL